MKKVTALHFVFCSCMFLLSCKSQNETNITKLCDPFMGKNTTWVERGFDSCGGKDWKPPFANVDDAKKHLNSLGVCVFAIHSKVNSSVFMTCEKDYNGIYYFAEIPTTHARKARKNGWD